MTHPWAFNLFHNKMTSLDLENSVFKKLWTLHRTSHFWNVHHRQVDEFQDSKTHATRSLKALSRCSTTTTIRVQAKRHHNGATGTTSTGSCKKYEGGMDCKLISLIVASYFHIFILQKFMKKKAEQAVYPSKESSTLQPKYLFDASTLVLPMCFECRRASRHLEMG